MEDITTILKPKDNDCKPFWTPSYDELTKKLLIPIEKNITTILY